MSSTEIAADGLRRTFRVIIPAADMKAELDAKIEEVRPKVQLKGFRPGKAPASHIRKLYGPSMMREIIDAKVQKAPESTLADVRPAGEPKLTLESDLNAVIGGGADLALSLEVDLLPEFEIQDPALIELEKQVAELDQARLDEALAKLAEANRAFEDREGPAETGDRLTIDFVGRIDGETFEGGSAEGAALTLGSGQFIPGFEDQLVGAKAGEDRIVAVSFPEDYPVEALRGKAAEFSVTVHEVKAPQPALADESLAERLGIESLSALTDLLRRREEQELAALSRTKAKRALFDKLDQAYDFPLPPGMLEAEFSQIWRQVEADREAGQLDEEDKEKSEEQLRLDYRRIAERRVRLGLVLAEIGRRNAIAVSDQELTDAVMAQARRFQGQERQVFDFYRQNANALAQLRAPIFEEKVVDFILELAKVTPRIVSREALLADDPPPAA